MNIPIYFTRGTISSANPYLFWRIINSMSHAYVIYDDDVALAIVVRHHLHSSKYSDNTGLGRGCHRVSITIGHSFFFTVHHIDRFQHFAVISISNGFFCLHRTLNISVHVCRIVVVPVDYRVPRRLMTAHAEQ